MFKNKKLTFLLIGSILVLGISIVISIILINSDSTRKLKSIVEDFKLLDTSGYELYSTQYNGEVLVNSDTIECKINKDQDLKAYVDRTFVRLNEIGVDTSDKYLTEIVCIFFKDNLYKLETDENWTECNIEEVLVLDFNQYINLLNKPKFELSEESLNSVYKVTYEQMSITINNKKYEVSNLNLTFTVETETSKILSMELGYTLDQNNCNIKINIYYDNQTVILPD